MPVRRNSLEIPLPRLQSWMCERVALPVETPQQRQRRYEMQVDQDRLIDAIASELLAKTRLLAPRRRWIFYRFAYRVAHFSFRALNRLEVRGLANVPRQGGIYVANHQSAIDPAILMAVLPYPPGIFVDSGYGWLADALETTLGFVSHQGAGDEVVEKMVRTLLFTNPHFAIWQEGYYEKDEVVGAFSGIVKVYAVLNNRRNVSPFVPVISQGAQCYRWEDSKRLGKICVTILKPRFLPRSWLRPPAEGGKTPREIIDSLMLVLAKKLGQSSLGKNYYLDSRRRYF
ncbi:MAG TPA: 1-acyl-sn-glycerol-3-phosphate acyltransferase [Candidatus Lokiarchaeia archaeon]|nr:1-acyl-sn-glycerol-3-phosphate acyltransferase [Candidatus Lokiarchaeia archaeon]